MCMQMYEFWLHFPNNSIFYFVVLFLFDTILSMKTIKVGINGFGRIGRIFLRLAWERPELEVVAVNDLSNVENLAYLLKHDTVYKTWDKDVKSDEHHIIVEGKSIKVLTEKEPNKLPWKDLGVDVVVEATGFFNTYEGSKLHLEAGAKKVVVTAPMKDEPVGVKGATVLMGVNEEKLKVCDITSNASCTTNSVSPVIAILHETLGIEKALLNTTHALTNSQPTVDSISKKDFREGRAGAYNMIPSSTGAAIAVTKAFPDLEGMFDGIAVRVPVIAGSIADITFISKKETTKEEVNKILKDAAKEKRWQGIFTTTEEALVSSDILGSPYGSIADLALTRVVGGNLVKVMAWYDNEMGYTYTLVDHVIKTGEKL
mgnify:FL=1